MTYPLPALAPAKPSLSRDTVTPPLTETDMSLRRGVSDPPNTPLTVYVSFFLLLTRPILIFPYYFLGLF